MSWKPNILTQNIISTFIEDLLDFLPEQLGIEEIISACEVISLDPQGLGLGVLPRPILCRVNNYYQLVQYRGGLPIVVGDFLTVVHLREGNRYEVLGAGGSGGVAAVQIHDHSSNAEGGQNLRQIEEHEFEDAILLTIAGGVIARTQVYHRVDTQGGGATDNLDTINGGTEGDILAIRPEDDARTIVIRHNIGNIWLIGEADISLEDAEDHIFLIYDGSAWCSLGDGGGGAAGGHDLLSVTHTDTDPQAVNQGSLVVGDATPDWTELVVGIAHAILKVNAGGTDPAWVAFDWDDIALAAGADMVHDHSAAGEGGEVPLASLGSYIQGSIMKGGGADWDTLVIGAARFLLMVNAGGTEPEWLAFDWDLMAIAAGADMVHDHSAAGEGGEVPLASLGGYTQGDIIYGGAADWQDLAIGAPGEVLVVNVGGTEPEWAAAGGAAHDLLSATHLDTDPATPTVEKRGVRWDEVNGYWEERGYVPDLAELHDHTYQEDMTPMVDGVETDFITMSEFAPETTMVWLNGALQRPVVDYVEGNFYDTIEFAGAPGGGDELLVAYTIA